MPSWSEVQEHMRKKYTLEDDQPDLLSMVWSYDDGRTQKIVIRHFRAFGLQLQGCGQAGQSGTHDSHTHE